ncbi:sugar ABC transporter substrate-binding protein [Oceanobacillus aidingensis]|uniref:Extracellular solute-binding protein n=1 Tax=Oceanobacillus aidingensis TaxID=645964 RepID=A0ABV9JSP9_9BACI
MFRKISVICFFSLFIFIVGCSSDTEGSDETNNDEQITITWWDSQALEPMVQAMESLIEDYESANPNVEIERTFVPFADIKDKLLLGAASDELPDIVMIDGADHQEFASSGVLEDITEEVTAWGEIDQYFEAPLSHVIYDEKYYGIPADTNNLALYYNADMLNDAGLEAPTTWEELEEAAEALTSENVFGFAIAAIKGEQLTYQHLPFLWQSGADMQELNSKETIDMLNYLNGFLDNGYMSRDTLTQDQQATFEQFMSGRVAMVMSGPWQLPIIKEEASFDWGLVPLPVGQNESTIVGGSDWAITSNSENKDIAWDILEFSQQPEYLIPFLQAGGRLPTREDISDDSYWTEDEHMKVFADQTPIAKARAYGSNYPAISEAFQEMVQEVYTGSKSSEQAAEEASKRINELLD